MQGLITSSFEKCLDVCVFFVCKTVSTLITFNFSIRIKRNLSSLLKLQYFVINHLARKSFPHRSPVPRPIQDRQNLFSSSSSTLRSSYLIDSFLLSQGCCPFLYLFYRFFKKPCPSLNYIRLMI
jgi:hypothetical protein